MRSQALFTPALYDDPERGGLVACWTRTEEQNQPEGGAFAAFLSEDGTVHPAVRLGSFDTRGESAVGCAPIPHSGGKILVSVWHQNTDRAEQQILVWSPATPNGYETGSSGGYYTETNAAPSQVVPIPAAYGYGYGVDVVGDRVWVPMLQTLPNTDTTAIGAQFRLVRLQVGEQERASGIPLRDEFLGRTTFFERWRLQFVSGVGGAWWLFADDMRLNFLSETERRSTLRYPIDAYLSGGLPGYTAPLATNTRGDPTAPEQELAVLWHDCSEPTAAGSLLRVAWLSNATLNLYPNVTLGPLLPLRRLDTAHPGSMQVDGQLYVFGTPDETLSPVVPHTCTPGVEPPNTSVSRDETTRSHGPLTVYRIHWGAAQDVQPEVVDTLERTIGDTIIPTAVARPFQNGRAYGLAWIEFYPPNPTVGNGATYALYLHRYTLP